VISACLSVYQSVCYAGALCINGWTDRRPIWELNQHCVIFGSQSPTAREEGVRVRCVVGNAQNGGTVLPFANLMADSEPETQISYSSSTVTVTLSHLVLYIFTCDTQTDGQTDNVYRLILWLVQSPHTGGPANDGCRVYAPGCRLQKYCQIIIPALSYCNPKFKPNTNPDLNPKPQSLPQFFR